MKFVLFILAITFTSFTVPKKATLTEHSKIIGVWKNTTANGNLEGLDFYPNGLICIHTHGHSQNASFKINEEQTGKAAEVTGKVFSYPEFSFLAKIDDSKAMELTVNYHGATKVIRMVKVKAIQSGFLLVK